MIIEAIQLVNSDDEDLVDVDPGPWTFDDVGGSVPGD
jgi:hypothetical protein